MRCDLGTRCVAVDFKYHAPFCKVMIYTDDHGEMIGAGAVEHNDMGECAVADYAVALNKAIDSSRVLDSDLALTAAEAERLLQYYHGRIQ